jgi:anti-sigma B factor antagonist
MHENGWKEDSMETSTTIEGTTATIALIGTLTVASTSRLETAIADLPADATDITLDFSNLEYVASAGLRVIVSQAKKATQRGGTLRIAHPNDEVMEVFDVTWLIDILDIVQ